MEKNWKNWDLALLWMFLEPKATVFFTNWDEANIAHRIERVALFRVHNLFKRKRPCRIPQSDPLNYSNTASKHLKTTIKQHKTTPELRFKQPLSTSKSPSTQHIWSPIKSCFFTELKATLRAMELPGAGSSKNPSYRQRSPPTSHQPPALAKASLAVVRNFGKGLMFLGVLGGCKSW